MKKELGTIGMFVTFVALLCMMSLMPLKAGAAPGKTVVNVTGQTATVRSYSTVYVGEVVFNGQQSFYYLYSDDINNGSMVIRSLWRSLLNINDGAYSAMIADGYVDYSSEKKGFAHCSNKDFETKMDANWKNALLAGIACLPKNTSVASSSSDDLFLSDADFAARCTFEEGVDIVDNAGNDFVISGPIGETSATNTDNVTYTVEDGVLVKHIDRQIDYTCESITVVYTRAEFQSPLTFEAVEDGTITVNLDDGATLNPIQYNLNDGEWTDVTWNYPIDLAANDVISFRGDNGTCNEGEDTWAGFHFQPSNPVYVYGNMMSLIDKDGFATNTTLTKTYTFFRLFQRSDYEPNTAILNHPTKDIVLPATTLTPYCYDGLFADAPNITRAPELPATTLADWCYSEMFFGTAITTAPALPATTLAPSCYADMFMICENLTTAPELPAATLVEGCYSSMFAGCTSLNYVKCLATDISADFCTVDWLWNVATSGTFVKAADMNGWTLDSPNGIPTGWTVMNNLVLADDADNSVAINAAATSGGVYEVTLDNRTLYKDGNWNTLCLPFSIDDFTGTILEDATVMILGNSPACNTSFDSTTGTLNLEFLPANEIEAGVPYIVKWDKAADYVGNESTYDITNPVFSSVTIDNEATADRSTVSQDHYVTFIGSYSPFNIAGENKGILFLGADNTMYYPEAAMQIGSCRAHFTVDLNGASEVRVFNLNFGGGETTGIQGVQGVQVVQGVQDDSWFTLDGRKLNGKPTAKGVYINGGRKIVIK